MKANLMLMAVLLTALPGGRQETKVTSTEQFFTQVIADLSGLDGLDFNVNLCADAASGRSGCFVSNMNAADLATRLHDRGYDTRFRLQRNHLIWSTAAVRGRFDVIVHVDPLARPTNDPRRVNALKDGFRSYVGINAAPHPLTLPRRPRPGVAEAVQNSDACPSGRGPAEERLRPWPCHARPRRRNLGGLQAVTTALIVSRQRGEAPVAAGFSIQPMDDLTDHQCLCDGAESYGSVAHLRGRHLLADTLMGLGVSLMNGGFRQITALLSGSRTRLGGTHDAADFREAARAV